MTVRFVMTVGLALGLSACSGTTGTDTTKTDKGGTTQTHNDKGGTTTATADTSGGGGTGGGTDFEPRSFKIEADLGFDGSTNTLVDVQTPTGAIPPAIYLLFGTAAWVASGFDSSLDAEYCAFGFPLTNPALANWASTDPTVYYGVEFDGAAGDVGTTCGDAAHPMSAIFGTDAVTSTLLDPAYGIWGAGVGDLSDTYYTGPYATTTGYVSDNLVGARVPNTMYVDPSLFYAYPIQIDPTTYDIQVDGNGYPVLIPKNQVYNGVSLKTAFYAIRSSIYYTFQ